MFNSLDGKVIRIQSEYVPFLPQVLTDDEFHALRRECVDDVLFHAAEDDFVVGDNGCFRRRRGGVAVGAGAYSSLRRR